MFSLSRPRVALVAASLALAGCAAPSPVGPDAPAPVTTTAPTATAPEPTNLHTMTGAAVLGGKPLADATLKVVDLVSGQAFDTQGTSKTDAEGKFSFEAKLPEGAIANLIVKGEQGAATALVTGDAAAGYRLAANNALNVDEVSTALTQLASGPARLAATLKAAEQRRVLAALRNELQKQQEALGKSLTDSAKALLAKVDPETGLLKAADTRSFNSALSAETRTMLTGLIQAAVDAIGEAARKSENLSGQTLTGAIDFPGTNLSGAVSGGGVTIRNAATGATTTVSAGSAAASNPGGSGGGSSTSQPFTYYDLDTQATVAESNNAWDLAFRGSEIKINNLNTGTDGAPRVLVAKSSTAYDTLAQAPGSGYAGDATPFTETAAWNATAALNTTTYVVHTTSFKFYKVKFTSYTGSGVPGIETAQITEPPLSPATYYRLSDGQIVTASDPWDIVTRRTLYGTNSGVSGSGQGGALLAPSGWTYAGTTKAITLQPYATDVKLFSGQPGALPAPANLALKDWFDYDMSTHVVTPKANTFFFVRTATGGYGKVRITGYADGVSTFDMAPLETVTEGTANISATDINDTAKWTYFHFRTGVWTPAPASEPSNWDIAFNKTLIKTHSGGNGGNGGAVELTGITALSQITSVPTATFQTDATISGEDDGLSVNGKVLSPAFVHAYDHPAGPPTPYTDKAYVVKTSEGDYVKLKLKSYSSASGVKFDWSY